MSKHEKHKMESSTFTIKKAKLKHLEDIRRFVDSEMSALNVHPDVTYDILLSTTEAITNIILHGYNGEEGLIEIEVKHRDDSVAVYLRDEAPQFDPTQIPTPDLTLPLEDRPVGGMGIHLIRQFMDHIIYRESPQGGNELILVKENVIQKHWRNKMEIDIERVEGKVSVIILELHGNLDASNFEEVIDKARNVYESGARDLLIDFGDVDFMSSSGIVALHSIALLMRGEQPHDLESGWDAFHAIDRDRDSGLQEHVKILNPQPKVALTFEKTGMDKFFEIYNDRQTAIDSF